MQAFLAQVKPVQLEVEWRALIEAVLKLAHLDRHALRIGGRADIFEVMLRLARDYGLALRVSGRSRIEYVQRQGLPTNDYDFSDSYQLAPANIAARYAQLLREYPVGLWAQVSQSVMERRKHS